MTELTVHAFKWDLIPGETPDDFDVIHAWCLDRESNPYLLRVEDFPAFCYVELPSHVNNISMQWSPNQCNDVYNAICSFLGDDKPLGYVSVRRERAYYYKLNKQYPMLILMFRRVEAMRKLKNRLNRPLYIQDYGKLEMQMWEDEIGSVRKLLSTRNVKYSQWFTVIGTEPEERIGTLSKEYIVNRSTMLPIPQEQTGNWSSNPKILAFDIETYSDNHKALPKAQYHNHCSFIISALSKRLNGKEVKRYAIVWGDCPPIKDSIIINVRDELELIRAFEKVVTDEDPDVITGYNVLLYDIPYLNIRLRRNIEYWGCIGRLNGVHSSVKTKSWSSSAYGIQNLNLLEIPGRIIIDLYPVIQRDYKLDMYTLDFVSKKFIKRGKHDVKAERMFRCFEDMQLCDKNWKTYCRNNNYDMETYTIDCVKPVVTIKEKSDEYLNLWSRWCKHNNYTEGPKTEEHGKLVWHSLQDARMELQKVTEYCIQDADLCLGLMESLNVWIGLVELSNIVGVTIVELFTSGQQIRCQSQLYDLAYRRNIVLDRDTRPDNSVFSGGAVQKPVRGLNLFVVCLDFASLYPSIQQAFNVCASTLIHPDIDAIIPDDMCNIIEFDQEEPRTIHILNNGEDIAGEFVHESEYTDMGEATVDDEIKSSSDTVIKHYKNRFIKKEYFEGLIPQLVKNLVMERNKVRKEMMKPLEKQVKTLQGKCIQLEIEKVKKLMGESKEKDDEIEQYVQLLLCEDKRYLKKMDEVFKGLKKKYESLPQTEENQMKINEHKTKIKEISLVLVVLDKRQLALKVSANSFFGLLGVHKNGKFPCMKAAISITAWGRQLIAEVIQKSSQKYADRNPQLIYGDTDSFFIKLRVDDPRECYKLGKELESYINGTKDVPGLFAPPLKMEMEKILHCICVEPKLYAYVELDENGDPILDSPDDIKKKGLFSARRGQSQIVKKLFDNILFTAFSGGNVCDAFNLIVGEALRLVENKVPWQELQQIRGLGANYKSESFFMNIFAQELKRIGKPQTPGSRLAYVVVKNDETLLGKKMKIIEDFLENKYEIDANYYLENVMMNPVDKIFAVAYNNVLPLMSHVGYQPQGRRKFVGVEHPIKMIIAMLRDGVKLDILKDWFLGHYNNVMRSQNKSIEAK